MGDQEQEDVTSSGNTPKKESVHLNVVVQKKKKQNENLHNIKRSRSEEMDKKIADEVLEEESNLAETEKSDGDTEADAHAPATNWKAVDTRKNAGKPRGTDSHQDDSDF